MVGVDCSRFKKYQRDVTTKHNVWDRIESWIGGKKKSFNIKEILETTGEIWIWIAY